MVKPKKFTIEEEQKLISMFNAGKIDKEIAKELNLKKQQITHKRKTLGLLKNSKIKGEEYIKNFRKKQGVYKKSLIDKFKEGDREPFWKYVIRKKVQDNKDPTRANRRRNGKIYKVDLIPQDLEEQWLKQRGCCNYTMEKLRPFIKGDPDYDFEKMLSVDQITPGKGYVKGNIQFLSYRANHIKMDYSHEHFMELLECMLENGKTIKFE